VLLDIWVGITSIIDFNGNNNGFNAELKKVQKTIDAVRRDHPTSRLFGLEVTANFYKKGHGYYNKIRSVTLSWLEDKDNEVHSFTIKDIDRRNLDLFDYYQKSFH